MFTVQSVHLPTLVFLTHHHSNGTWFPKDGYKVCIFAFAASVLRWLVDFINKKLVGGFNDCLSYLG
jgi:hypothetical protein